MRVIGCGEGVRVGVGYKVMIGRGGGWGEGGKEWLGEWHGTPTATTFFS
jgi:hypothetical protein